MKLIKNLGMATSEKRETMSSLGFDRVMTRDRMRQSLKGRALSRAFSSRSAGEDFIFKCLFKSLAKAQKDRKRWISSELIKYMGLLPADFSFHYVINIVNSDNDCIGLGSGESSGSSSLPTTRWEVWEQFSQTKCPKAQPLVDSACPNPMQQSLLNCIKFLQRPKIFCDIFAEGFGNRVRISTKLTFFIVLSKPSSKKEDLHWGQYRKEPGPFYPGLIMRALLDLLIIPFLRL